MFEDIFQRRLIWRRRQPAPLKLDSGRRLAQFRLLPPLPQFAQAGLQFILGSGSRPHRLMLLMWTRRPVWWLGRSRKGRVKGWTRLRNIQWTLIWFLIHQQSTYLKTHRCHQAIDTHPSRRAERRESTTAGTISEGVKNIVLHLPAMALSPPRGVQAGTNPV
jgi:hypothetical protein